jgi:TonB family protein
MPRDAMRGPIRAIASLVASTVVACSISHPAPRPAPQARTRDTRAGTAPAPPRCPDIQAPELIRRAEPTYPDDLRKEGVQGKVVLKAYLDGEGKLRNIQVSSSPDSRLSELAVEAFQKWQYRPARCAGKPVPVYITSTLSFDLRK